MDIITDATRWAPLGIIPWFTDAWKLPAEDVMDITSKTGGDIKIAVPRLNRIANFDDLDPLSATPGISVQIIEAGRPLPGDADLIIIPGSKSTIADLAHFRTQGWDIDLAGHVRRGGQVLGVCGGYQMLGQDISDPDGIEGAATTVPGLGLLEHSNRHEAAKATVHKPPPPIWQRATPSAATKSTSAKPPDPIATGRGCPSTTDPKGPRRRMGKSKAVICTGCSPLTASARHS